MASRSRRRRLPALSALVLGVALPGGASAHIELLQPDARYGPGQQKNDPCGAAENTPGETITAYYQPGETITLQVDEFVDHSSYYRVALDPTGTDDFTSPAAFDDFYNSPQVLLDDIPDDQDGGLLEIEVTLPEIECERCTLQLIQVMTDDGAFGPGNDDLYFQCADIAIGVAGAETGEPPPPGDSSAGPSDDGGPFGGSTDAVETEGMAEAERSEGEGCGCRARPAPPLAAAWLLLPLLALRRRR